MKVLITGGAGFIGSHLADRLLARGDVVRVIDNFSTGRRDNLTSHANLVIMEGSIATGDLVHYVNGGFKPDVVVHAAASYQDPDNWLEDVETNVKGTANVVRYARQYNVKRLIYFQTSLCYGYPKDATPIPIDAPQAPAIASYAITKTAAENYIAFSGIDYISFRLANAYGPRNLSGPTPTFYQRLTTGKGIYAAKTRRDFIYIDDLLQLVLMAIDGKGSRGAYHASTGSDYAIKQMADAVVKALGMTYEVPERERAPDDVERILLDPSKTIRDFGWKPTTPLETGVAAAVEWYKTHEITRTYTHLRNYEQD